MTTTTEYHGGWRSTDTRTSLERADDNFIALWGNVALDYYQRWERGYITRAQLHDVWARIERRETV